MKNKGFTLIELIVAIAVFSLVIPAAMSIFTSGLKGQRKGYAIQVAQENIRYVLESMSKEIRMSHVNATSTADILGIVAYKDTGFEGVTYSLSGGRIVRNGEAITSSKINVTNLKFYFSNINDPPAAVTIALAMESIGDRPEERTKVNLQTTVSTRDY